MEVRSSQAFSNTHTKELTYLYAGGTPFAIHEKNGEDEALYYLHLDHQGSIRAITNEQGNIVEQRDYDAWGRPPRSRAFAMRENSFNIPPFSPRSRASRLTGHVLQCVRTITV